MRTKFVTIMAVVLAATLLFAVSAQAETRLRVASTTSTQNSGLFDYLLPIFEEKTGLKQL